MNTTAENILAKMPDDAPLVTRVIFAAEALEVQACTCMWAANYHAPHRANCAAGQILLRAFGSADLVARYQRGELGL